MVENVTSECDVEINGNLKHTIGYNLYLPSSNNNATEDYNITTVLGNFSAINFSRISVKQNKISKNEPFFESLSNLLRSCY
jgi:hypothetical protein